MVERGTPWPVGTPNWVELAADDPEAAAVFYAGLFGWDCEHQTSPEYWICSLAGDEVAGIGPKRPGTEHLPSRWTTYLAAVHVDRTADTVVARGGKILLAPSEVASHGRTAIVADPNGAVFGLWQAGDHLGTDRGTRPGSLVWSEALSRDYEIAKDFYPAVFGYRVEEIGTKFDPGEPYAEARYAALYAAGKPVAGIGELHPGMPSDTPPHWLPYFAVEGADATVAQVLRTGGRLLERPLDTDFGRVAVLEDPESVAFAVIQLA